MIQSLHIPVRFPSLNEYIAAMNRNRFIGNKMKKEFTELTAWYAKKQGLGHFTLPITLSFDYYESNARRDPDNIMFAKKFILDGLVAAGVITDDNQKWIHGVDYEHWMVVPKEEVGVSVIMTEVENGRIL